MGFLGGASIIGAGLNATGGLISGALNYRYQKKLAAKQFDYDNQLLDKQNAFNVDMWNRQNEYNDPASQAQRFEDAGFNPAMMMATNGASEAQQVSSANPSFSTPGNPGLFNFNALGSDAVNAFIGTKQMLADLKLKEAQAKAAESSAGASDAEALYKKALTNTENLTRDEKLENLKALVSNLRSSSNLSDHQAEQIEKILPYLADLKQAELDKLIADSNLSHQQALSEISKRYNLDKDSALKIVQAYYYRTAGDVNEADELLKGVQTGKTLKELEKIEEEIGVMHEDNSRKHFDNKLRQDGFDPNINPINNVLFWLNRQVDKVKNFKPWERYFKDKPDDTSALEGAIDKDLDRFLAYSARSSHRTHRNPDYFRLQV